PACLTRQATAALGDVALAGRRPADDPDRQEHIGRARGACAGAHLIRITRVARAGPAHRPGVAGRVLAGAVRAVAEVGGAGRAVGLLGVGRARGAAAGAEVVEVTVAHRRAANRRRGLERIGGTRGARAGARFGHVADARRGATRRSRVARRVLAGVGGAVALIRGAGVAVVRAGRTGRLRPVGRAAPAV